MARLATSWQIIRSIGHAHVLRNQLGNVIYGQRSVRADVNHLIDCQRIVWSRGDDRSNIRNMREPARLCSVAEYRKRLIAQSLADENADDVSKWIGEVLTLAVYVVGPKHDVPEAEHCRRFREI